MRLHQLFHNTYKESPYKLELESQNVLARAGFLKKGSKGDYCFSTIGSVFYQGIQDQLLDLFRHKAYGYFLGSDPETLFQGDVKSFRHLGKGLVGAYAHTEGDVWPKLGLAECKNRTEIAALRLFADGEAATEEMHQVHQDLINLLGFNAHSLDWVNDGGAESYSHSLCYGHDSGSASYFECAGCGSKMTLNSTAEPRKIACPVEVEKTEPAEEVYTPDVRTIQHLENFFDLPGSTFLKTIVVEMNGAYYAVLLKGDRELNLFKLGRLLGVHESSIKLADKATFAETMGVEAGFIGPVGLKNIKIIADDEVVQGSPLICGGNKNNYHIKNVYAGRDYQVHLSGDLKSLEHYDVCPKCHQQKLVKRQGFKLAQFTAGPADGVHTLQAIRYIDQNGKEAQAYAARCQLDLNHVVAMVCESALVEGGILFKSNLAPFDYILTLINPADEIQVAVAEEMYQSLVSLGKRVLLDDTDERAGVKFSNADLMGVANRITVGKVAAEGLVELKNRWANTSEKVEFKEFLMHMKVEK